MGNKFSDIRKLTFLIYEKFSDNRKQFSDSRKIN